MAGDGAEEQGGRRGGEVEVAARVFRWVGLCGLEGPGPYSGICRCLWWRYLARVGEGEGVLPVAGDDRERLRAEAHSVEVASGGRGREGRREGIAQAGTVGYELVISVFLGRASVVAEVEVASGGSC